MSTHGSINTEKLEQLVELIGGDRQSFGELAQSFLHEGAQILSALHQAASSADAPNDQETVRRGAHSLKSNARDFGATGLADMAASLEMSCKNELPGDTAARVGQMAGEFERVQAELTRYLSNNSGT
jgi:HPt (histidine-containing phosphotransfer) domain-containing protein